MTTDDLLDLERGYSESKIQHTCVAWFRETFPEMARLMYAVPNGGQRSAKVGAAMKYEGQVRGVADLCLPHSLDCKGSLYIEMKTPKRKGSSAGRQSEHQKEWQDLVERFGNTYVVCHGLAEFVDSVCRYLGEDSDRHLRRALDQYPRYL